MLHYRMNKRDSRIAPKRPYDALVDMLKAIVDGSAVSVPEVVLQSVGPVE